MPERPGDSTRRDFLVRAGAVAAASVLAPGVVEAGQAPATAVGPGGTSGDPLEFPRKADFAMRPGITYLNGAYTHPMPLVARDAVRDYLVARTELCTPTSTPTRTSARRSRRNTPP